MAAAHILHPPPPQSSVPWGPILGVGAIAAGGVVIWWLIPSAEDVTDTAKTIGEGATDIGDDVVDFGVDTADKVTGFLGKTIGGTAKGVAQGIDAVFGRDGWVDDLVHWPWEK